MLYESARGHAGFRKVKDLLLAHRRTQLGLEIQG